MLPRAPGHIGDYIEVGAAVIPSSGKKARDLEPKSSDGFSVLTWMAFSPNAFLQKKKLLYALIPYTFSLLKNIHNYNFW